MIDGMAPHDFAQYIMIAFSIVVGFVGLWRPKVTTKSVVKEINDYQLKAGNMK